MTFSSPWWLVLLGLVPVIVALHSRRRRRQIVGSVFLWSALRSMETTSAWHRVRPRDLVRLFAQLAVLVAIALLLAEPRVAASAPSGPSVLILDAGVTMAVRDGPSQPSRYERAAEAWLDDQRYGRGPWSVWWAGPRPVPLIVSADSLDDVRTALERSRPADAPSDWDAAAEAIHATLQDSVQIRLATAEPSLPRSLATLAADAASGIDVASYARSFENVGITHVAIERAEAPPTGWDVAVRARAYGDVPPEEREVMVQVMFQPTGTLTPLEVARGPLRFSLAGRAETSWTLQLPGSGLLVVHTEPSDDYLADDTWRAVLNPSVSRPKVLVVTDLGDSSSTFNVLQAMERFDVSHSPSVMEPGKYSLIVVDGVDDPFAASIGEHSGSNVLWLGSAPGVSEGSTRRRVDPAVSWWDATHPVALGTSWASSDASYALELPDLDRGRVVVAGVSTPIVQTSTTLHGRHVVIGLDPHDPAWTSSGTYLTFVADATSWLLPEPEAARFCSVGVACRFDPRRLDDSTSLVMDDVTLWRWPSVRQPSVPDSLATSWSPRNAGLARWEAGRDAVHDLVPVNLSPNVVPALEQAASVEADASRLTPSRGGPRANWPARALVIAVISTILLAEVVSAGIGREGFLWLPGRSIPPAMGKRQAWATGATASLGLFAIAAVAALSWPKLTLGPDVLVVSSPDRVESIGESIGDDWLQSDTRVQVIDESTTGTGVIDLERALDLAVAHGVPGASHHVVLAPSARSGRGDPLRFLTNRSASTTTIDVVMPPSREASDVVVSKNGLIGAPRKGETIHAIAAVVSGVAQTVTVRVLRNGDVTNEVPADLQQGTTLLRLPVPVPDVERMGITVEVTAEGDPVAENNRVSWVLDVTEGPNVVVAADDLAEAEAFSELLAVQGITSEVRRPESFSADPALLLGTDGVVLVDTPALELTTSQQEALRDWVRDYGGGLLVIGGPESFSAGGYLETPLDDLSPLSSRVTRDAPEVALVFVLDRSGSMQQQVEGVGRLDIAKQATVRAIELLGEGSQVAIVAFDDRARTVLSFTPASDRQAIEASLARITPGGGTSIYPGLVQARIELERSDAALRHVIVLTDGLSQPGDFESIASDLRRMGATVSTVAVGVGADAERVRSIAALGGGTAHVSTDFRSLPGIMAQEASRHAGETVVLHTIAPQWANSDRHSDVARGLPRRLPPLYGLVETTAKPGADLHLVDDSDRPVLATWKYGNGRVLAFASDVTGPWSRAWQDQSAYPAWWSQWVRATARPTTTPGIHTETVVVRDEVWVTATVVQDDGTIAEGLVLDASIRMRASDGDDGLLVGQQRSPAIVSSRTMREVAAGRYSAVLPISVGEAEVEVSIPSEGDVAVSRTAVSHAYPAHHGSSLGDVSTLTLLARATGGETYASDAFPPAPRAHWNASMMPAWRPWLVLLLIVWLAILAQRYDGLRLIYQPKRLANH